MDPNDAHLFYMDVSQEVCPTSESLPFMHSMWAMGSTTHTFVDTSELCQCLTSPFPPIDQKLELNLVHGTELKTLVVCINGPLIKTGNRG
jgi:hypothetical protein